MTGIDWGQELTWVRHATEEMAASDDRETLLRAGGAAVVRMLIRTGAIAPDDELLAEMNAYLHDDIVGEEVGQPVAHFGPCYLHAVTWLGKDGVRKPTEHYRIMVGVVETPIIGMLDFATGKWQAPKLPQDASWVPVAASGMTDVARHLRRMLIRKRAGLDFDRAWQRTHPDHAAERDGTITFAEQCIAVWEAGLREFEAGYGTVLATPEANLSAEEQEREAEEVRRAYAILSDFLDYVRAQQARSTGDDAEAAYQRGSAHWHHGEYEAAIEEYTKAIRLNPDNAAVYNDRGVAYDALGQHALALSDLDTAIRLNPDEARSYFSRGVTYCHMTLYERALDDLTVAIRLAPDYARAYHSRGLAHYHCNDFDPALTDLDAAIRLDPTNAVLYYDRGIVHRDLKQDEQALQRHFVDRRATLLCQTEEGVWQAATAAQPFASNTGPTFSPICMSGSLSVVPARRCASGSAATCPACSATSSARTVGS